MRSEIVTKALTTNLWATEVDATPLSRRAWTLQERLLSTRCLHFTESQLFWECQSAKACEAWPELESKHIPPIAIFAEEPVLKPVRKLDGATLTPSDEHWEEIVEIYTDANLTMPDDKLVAISSLAIAVQQTMKDQYYAGLWKRDFARSLLYYAEVPQITPNASYRAPSWSWAAIDGKVRFVCKSKPRMTFVAQIESIWTLGVDDKRGSTGKIKDGAFSISAPTLDICRCDKEGKCYRLALSHESLESFMSEYFPDTMTKNFPENAICLPILYYTEDTLDNEHETQSSLIGLVVVPTGNFRQEYQRLGVFRMNSSEGEYCLRGLEWKTLSVV